MADTAKLVSKLYDNAEHSNRVLEVVRRDVELACGRKGFWSAISSLFGG